MPYIILKKTNISGQMKTIIVNDSEGEPIEYTTLEQAQKIATLFQSKTTQSSVYEVRKIGHGTSD